MINWSTFIAIFTAIGGFEFIKWLFSLKSNKRMNKLQAEIAEIQAKTNDFHLLKERIELAEKQLLDKEQRFHEQTLLVRDLNKQLLDKTVKIGQLEARISELEAERKMKLCERRGCNRREPQSGY